MDEMDMYFDSDCTPSDFVKLSHLSNKSSVLCPESQDITSQYLVLQQLHAHQRMIARAKSTVDMSAPKSLRSYISVADRQRKKSWQRMHTQSRESNLGDSNYGQLASSAGGPFLSSEEDDNVSLNASSVNKGVQTCVPFTSFNCITDDKIAWYLDALSQGELHSLSRECNFRPSGKTDSARRRAVKGDIMDSHPDLFVQSQKDFSPRILANTSAKSKVKEMRCYNPPFRRKKSSSSNSVDTFESYDHENESDEDDVRKSSDVSSVEDETQLNQSLPPSTPSLQRSTFQPRNYEHTPVLNRNEEDKYLNFLSKVTEDILRSGVYSDRAVQQAFEFHIQFYQEANKDELQSLLNQILNGLKISEDDSAHLLSRRHATFSPPNTPPEKEGPDVLRNGDSELSTRLTEEGSHTLQDALQIDANRSESDSQTPHIS